MPSFAPVCSCGAEVQVRLRLLGRVFPFGGRVAAYGAFFGGVRACVWAAVEPAARGCRYCGLSSESVIK